MYRESMSNIWWSDISLKSNLFSRFLFVTGKAWAILDKVTFLKNQFIFKLSIWYRESMNNIWWNDICLRSNSLSRNCIYKQRKKNRQKYTAGINKGWEKYVSPVHLKGLGLKKSICYVHSDEKKRTQFQMRKKIWVNHE